ncbi:MgtC/SapB family protein [Bacillus sp. UNC41MFS5]|uniref:MgtC/SapB family protein n=1 Tax=Bacillus sp. UNC41MFS5 TaxID=1449046 RepID=UPI00047ADCEB|nr:MgtC/SapB family protein [Bacillus sp. UNC41MFS5]
MSLEAISIRLGMAAVLGIIIGLERELKQKPLGLKTCVVISVISCLITVVSIESADLYAKMNSNIRTDPMRLTAQVISGIGFLGAGVILRKRNNVISGLTTAAIIWGASGVGIAVGAGFYYEACISIGIILFSLKVLPLIVNLFIPKTLSSKELKVKFLILDQVDISKIIEKVKCQNYNVNDIYIKDLQEGQYQMELVLKVPKEKNASEIFTSIRKISDINILEIGSN